MVGVEPCFEHCAVYATLLTYLYRVWEAEFYKQNDERHMTFYFDDWRQNTEVVLLKTLQWLGKEVTPEREAMLKKLMEKHKQRERRTYEINYKFEDFFKDHELVARTIETGLCLNPPKDALNS